MGDAGQLGVNQALALNRLTSCPDSLSPHLVQRLWLLAHWGKLRAGMGTVQLTISRSRTPLASRMPVSRLKQKAGPAVEAVSIACAHLFAVAAMVVIAGLVFYAR